MTAVDAPTDKDEELVNRLRQMFVRARQAKTPYYETWNRNYRLINNKMGGKPATSWQPAPRDSETYPTIAALVAWMADQHTSVDMTAACDPQSPYYQFMQRLADDMATVLQTNWYVLDYEAQIKLALWDAFMFNTGIFKVVWDNALDDGMGNVMLKRVDPWSFYIDPNCGPDLDEAEYMIEARRMSINDIERRWPDKAQQVRDATSDTFGSIEEHPQRIKGGQPGAMANPGNLPVSGTLTSYVNGVGTRWGSPKHRTGPKPGIVVYEFWIKENEKIPSDDKYTQKSESMQAAEYKARWRVVVTAANVVLMDEYADDLWSYASHPYERYVWDDTGEFYGVALVDHLAYPQIYINRLLTAMQQNAELVGNPILIESAASGMERTAVVNRPGQRIRVNGPGGMANKPEWLMPPEMPQSVSNLVQFWIDRMGNVSGRTEAVQGGTATSDRMSSETLGTIQEAAFVRVRSALANLEGTLRRAAYKMADLIVDNYDEPRYMAVVGPTGSQTAIALKARHFDIPTKAGAPPFKYSLVIQAGAAAPTSRQTRMSESDQAYVWGIIDRQAWMEAHQYPNWQAVLQRVNQAQQDGTFNPPGQRQKRQKAS